MKTKIITMIIILLGITPLSQAQKYLTKNGYVKFFSETPMENIEAHNTQVNSAFDLETNNFVFKVLMKSFEFEKALMQEHFNENYVHSDEFPNATFVGKVINADMIDFNDEGTYDVIVRGDLTLHGVTHEIETQGTFSIGKDNIIGRSVFEIRPADYDIKIPAAVKNNIAENIEISVDVDLRKFESTARK